MFLMPLAASLPPEAVPPTAPKKTGPLFLTCSAPNSLKARVPTTFFCDPSSLSYPEVSFPASKYI